MATDNRGKKAYSSEDHRLAFETFYQHRTFSSVIETLQIAHTTAQNWSLPSYKCPTGCPWHGYARLIAEREAMNAARSSLLEKGIVDPVAHEEAAKNAITNVPDARRQAAEAFLKSDLEILQHWELVYNRVFYDLTKIKLDFQLMKDTEGNWIPIEKFLEPGLHLETASEAIRVMAIIRDRIDSIKLRMGINKPAEEAKVEGVPAASKQISLQDLREMKEKLRNTDPEVLKMMAGALKREEAHLEPLKVVG